MDANRNLTIIYSIVIVTMIKFNFIVSLLRKDVIDMLERIVTRIGISPFSAQQHLGVYRSFLVSVFIAKHFNGETFLRIDDTNPRHQANIDALIDDLTQIIEPSLLDSPRNSETGIYYVGSDSIPAIFESQRFELYHKYLNILQEHELLIHEADAIYFDTKKYIELYGDLIDLPYQSKPYRSGLITKSLPQLYFPIAVDNGRRFLWHFASVIDDNAFDVTHIVRAKDKIDNQVPQTILNRALGFTLPQYLYTKIMLSGHPLPKIIDLTATGISIQAIRSYLYGTITGNSEKPYFSFEEALMDFSPKSVTPGQFYFDFKKLQSVQKHFFNHQKPSD